MKFPARFLSGVLLVVAPLAHYGPLALAQKSEAISINSGSSGFAAVSNIRLQHDPGRSTLRITATQALAPNIQKIDSPPRIVIDLPNARVAVKSKKIRVGADRIADIRIDQFQDRPPVTRIVIDLLEPHTFRWSAAGNVLLVTLEPVGLPPSTTEQPEGVPGLSSGPEPLAVPVSSSSSVAVTLAGSRLAAGSSVTAGGETAELRLTRGGQVRVCPGTTVSVTPSPNGRDLMLALSTGALETHYRLDASADSILTPDFRIQFPGPGEFHYAISADSRGNTCVRSLMGNTGSAVVTELIGDRTYQIKPTDQLVFHSGRLDQVDAAVPIECGCPPPVTPVLRTQAQPKPLPESQAPDAVRLATGEQTRNIVDHGSEETAKNMPAQPETAPLPPTTKEEIHVQVDAPLVFRASDLPPRPSAKAAASTPTGETSKGAGATTANTVQAGSSAPTITGSKAEHRGLFRKIGGFFAAIFR